MLPPGHDERARPEGSPGPLNEFAVFRPSFPPQMHQTLSPIGVSAYFSAVTRQRLPSDAMSDVGASLRTTAFGSSEGRRTSSELADGVELLTGLEPPMRKG